MAKAVSIAALFLLTACASTGAAEEGARCTWMGGPWSTGWSTGDGIETAPLTVMVTPGGLVSGTWGDPVAGEISGHAVGPEGATIVGWWTSAMSRAQEGGFLLHLSNTAPDENSRCHFEGVYTTVAAQEPLGWFGERAAP
jgi:hypothetical protein